ncbi:MAG: response regulator [Candidatus Odinarchaeota archaeon]
MRAVIVEDSKVAFLSLKTQLEKLNVRTVLDAATIEDLEAKLGTTDSPDFATMDMALPDGNGVMGCEVIWKKYPNLPIIMVTIDPVSDELKQKLGDRVKDYIIKPVNEEKIKAALDKL